ncbi:MAG: DUF86 domain-containing protein, partial [ANME-2 cluster archaeon]|nr:DUF86 domain-containing protein [ANME-2 cluster archaeon]
SHLHLIYSLYNWILVLCHLKSVRNTDIKTLENNYELRSSVERNFHLAIEIAIDIGEIIISEEGYERPEDYRSVFLIIGRQGTNV